MSLLAQYATRGATPCSRQVTKFRSGFANARYIHITPTATLRSKKEDLLDRESINTTSTEYSKSGGDQAAAQESEAFDPNNTSPEGEKEAGRQREGGDSENPLNVSPANHDISKPVSEERPDKSPSEAAGQRKQSGGGSPTKHSKGRKQ